MSYTEFHSGKLIKISDNAEEYADKMIEQIPEYFNSKLEYLIYENDNKYFKFNNKLFEIVDHFKSDDSDFFQVTENPDGTFSFVGSFYNGGTCLLECLEDELNELYNKK